MRRRTNSTLEVPPQYLVRNVSVVHVQWHRIGGATCTAVDLSTPPPSLGKGQKTGDEPASEQFEDLLQFEDLKFFESAVFAFRQGNARTPCRRHGVF